jgi:DNA-binding MarR family transcriptional regulator
MSLDQPSSGLSDKQLRKRVAARAELEEQVTVRTIVEDLTEQLNVDEPAVLEQIDTLEGSGFVYLDGSGLDAEVRVP